MPARVTLGRPLTLPSGSVLRNRLVKAAMGEGLVGANGGPDDRLVRLYDRWGKSGAALLITGNVMVDAGGRGEGAQIVVEDDRHLPGLRRWAQAAQAHGAALWMQINHAGRQSPRPLSKQPVAPSAVAMEGMFGAFAKPRPLAPREVEELVRRFAVAAALARDAGFAGVQIHGAHGYLVSQFLSPLTNRRDDEWGGDPPRRRRFLVEIVRAVRREVGARFPVSVKLNSADFQRGGFDIGESVEVAQVLEAEGVDVVEISGGTYERPAMSGAVSVLGARASTRAREAYFFAYARRIRDATRLPLLLTGGFRSATAMAEAIESGAVDLIGIARPMSTEPDLPSRLLDGSAVAAKPVTAHVSVRALNDLLQVAWFQEQLHLIALGRDPDLTLGRWRVVWRTLARNLFGSSQAQPRVALPRATPATES